MKFSLPMLLVLPLVVSAAVSFGAASERLRIGLLSDVHLENAESAEKFEKALMTYRDCGVDGVLICGDLSDHGILPELKLVVPRN